MIAIKRRPVGEEVARAAKVARLPKWAEGYQLRFLRSGSEAIALALILLRTTSEPKRRFVVISGYCCPEIVAAIEFVGLIPLIVDTEKFSPFLDSSTMKGVLDENVLAIIACHFLGMRENVGELCRMAESVGATVIEDSAQFIPGDDRDGPSAQLVIYSFGRGKPVAALGGGMLLFRDLENSILDGVEILQDKSRLWNSRTVLELRRMCYNLAIRDLSFSLLSKIDTLGIGEVRKTPLRGLGFLNRNHAELCVSGLQAFRASITASQAVIDEWLNGQESFIRIANMLRYDRRLLRYPLVCKSKLERDQIFDLLQEKGCGASLMYGRTVDKFCSQNSYLASRLNNANNFADRLITLPVYSGLSASQTRGIIGLLDN